MSELTMDMQCTVPDDNLVRIQTNLISQEKRDPLHRPDYDFGTMTDSDRHIAGQDGQPSLAEDEVGLEAALMVGRAIMSARQSGDPEVEPSYFVGRARKDPVKLRALANLAVLGDRWRDVIV